MSQGGIIALQHAVSIRAEAISASAFAFSEMPISKVSRKGCRKGIFRQH
jgi:hypothetical protein